MSRRLADLKGPEISERITERSTVILPLGAVEQHGPHLPLNVDLTMATSFADAVVESRGDELDLWLLPPLAITKSNEHAWSPGTMWLSPETLLAVLRDIGRCVATTAARRLVFLNAHGGNTTLLNVACRELRLDTGLLTFLVHPSVPPAYGGTGNPAERGMGLHGGIGETSLMLHLRPEQVDMSKAVRNLPDWMLDNEYARFGGPVQFGWTTADFGPDGHVGDPTLATAEEGARLFAQTVELLGNQLAEIAVFDFPT